MSTLGASLVLLVILNAPASFEGLDLAKMPVDEKLVREALHERIQGSMREIEEMAYNLQIFARPTEKADKLRAQIEAEGQAIVFKMAQAGKIVTDAFAVGTPTLREFEDDQSVRAWEASISEFTVWRKNKLETVRLNLQN